MSRAELKKATHSPSWLSMGADALEGELTTVAPKRLELTSTVLPSLESRTNTSSFWLASRGAKSAELETNATIRPLPEIAGDQEDRAAAPPFVFTLASVQVPAWRSHR